MPNCQELFLKLLIKLYESQKYKSFRFGKCMCWENRMMGVWSFGLLKKSVVGVSDWCKIPVK